MNEKICKHCRHWELPPARSELDYGCCDLATSDSGVPINPDSPVIALDAEGYHAYLSTKPDFGCNEWTKKPTTDSP